MSRGAFGRLHAAGLNTGALAELRHLVDRFRHVGHLDAHWDPLQMWKRTGSGTQTSLERFPLLQAAAAAGESVTVAEAVAAGVSPALLGGATEQPAAAVLSSLRGTYSGGVGAEFGYVDDEAERQWLATAFEEAFHPEAAPLSPAAATNAYVAMAKAEAFELFLAKKMPTYKRYSGEGVEALLPALDTVFSTAARLGVKDVVLGKAHRGRLALLVGLLDFPARKMLWKILSNDEFPEEVQALDDVAPHLGMSVDKKYPHGTVHVSMLQNPSHLEAVDPVVMGKARAKQLRGSPGALPIMIHGDAAFSGQGIVPETFSLSYLPGFSVGGSIHITVNNQVGFTAEGREGRSSTYASDICKMIRAPVLHVNAENLDHVVKAATLAMQYRQQFGKDILLDITGYRRHGHNEVDEPSFTQPLMYKAIRSRPSSVQLYGNKLVQSGQMTEAWRTNLTAKLNQHLEAEYAAATTNYSAEGGSMWVKGCRPPVSAGHPALYDGTAFAGSWSSMQQATPADMARNDPTGIPVADLLRIGKTSVSVPPEYKVHQRLARSHIDSRLEQLEKGSVDWATAEALAFGSLVDSSKTYVRLVGQDSQRGTFSQRHGTLTCQDTGKRFTPLNQLSTAATAKVDIVSSNLSELAVMGYEYGFSMEHPNALCLWEAQFGDFANAAQVMIDNLISGSETKWMRQTGLVLLLPHGFDGVGPEHSSCRVERFLQLVNSQAYARGSPTVSSCPDKCIHEATNMIVAQPSTPANYFHLLRRQITRNFRKPLIVVAPKTLLRHNDAMSTLDSMGPGTAFQPVIGDAAAAANAGEVTRVLLTSGKMAYDLAKTRAEVEGSSIKTAIIRIEELAPFPTEALHQQLDQFKAATSFAWVQEEGAGNGAWTWVDAHVSAMKHGRKKIALTYIGRPSMAQPAVGMSKRNKVQGDHIIAHAFPKA